ncbi:hypothetical protein ACFOKF_25550 [Sphingobium rhizovicinum]|uniref:Uncharacterized protein n=1 Tax=Sphingobium rhizovicinum TaxID=432308 RepID=A0ABV7NNR1_9SPHN
MSARSATCTAMVEADRKLLTEPVSPSPSDTLYRATFGGFDLFARIDILAGVHRVFDQFAADADQLAQQGKVVNLAGEVTRADQRRAIAGQLRR